jgi:predicted SnoaL-like aldol condensation-catalyzing enzyme
MKSLVVAFLAAGTVAAPFAVAQDRHSGRTDAEQRNLDFVLDFWNNVWTKRDPVRVKQIYAADYIEHNPVVVGGVDGIVEYVTKARERERRLGLPGPTRSADFLMTMVDGDIVTLIFPRQLPDPCQPGKTIPHMGFEMLRVRDNKIVEHWDDAVPPAGSSDKAPRSSQ